MKIVLTGAGGFIGRRLTELLLKHDFGTGREFNDLVLLDRAFPDGYAIDDARVRLVRGEVVDAGLMEGLIATDSDWVIHLAATLVIHAEENFDEGMDINFHSVENILNICRKADRKVRFFIPSTIAVFSGALPFYVDDDQPVRPASSYGCEKALCELLVNEYARRGFVDCRSLRLPFVLHRPGLPNGFVSDIVSGITREPLYGRDIDIPWDPKTRMSVASVGRVAASIVALMDLEEGAFGSTRVTNMPSISVTISEMIESLGRLGGRELETHINWTPDERLQAVVDAWPRHFVSSFAMNNGIFPDASFEAMLGDFIASQNIKLNAGAAAR